MLGSKVPLIPKEFDGYKTVKRIMTNEGSSIFLVEKMNTLKDYVAKVVRRIDITRPEMKQRLEKEIFVSQKLNHPGIVRIVETLYLEDHVIIIMEYCSNGSLASLIASGKKFHDYEVLKISKQILAALDYLHQRGFAHRDIKPDNIVFDENMNPKLIGFGICSDDAADNLLTTSCGTVAFVAPEVFTSKGYDGRLADIWSLGVTIFTMAYGKIPWKDGNVNNTLRQIVNWNGEFPDRMAPTTKTLLSYMLVKEPAKRRSADELLGLSLFSIANTGSCLSIDITKISAKMILSEKKPSVPIRKRFVFSRPPIFKPKSNSSSLALLSTI